MQILKSNFNFSFNDDNFSFSRVPEGLEPFIIYEICRFFENKNILVILQNNEQVDRYINIIEQNVKNFNILSFPGWDCSPYDTTSPDPILISNRFKAIRSFIRNKKSNNLIVTTLNSLLLKIPPVKDSIINAIKLETGKDYEAYKVINILSQLGYNRVELVLGPNEYAARGGIIDLWPIGEAKPFRIDFFGNTIEAIKEFNPISQISLSKKSNIDIFQSIESPFNRKAKNLFVSNYRDRFGPVINKQLFIHNILQANKIDSIEHWLPLFYSDHLLNQFELFKPSLIIANENTNNLAKEKIEDIQKLYKEKLEIYKANKDEYNGPLKPTELYLDYSNLSNGLKSCQMISYTNYDRLESQSNYSLKSKENLEFLVKKNTNKKDIKKKLAEVIANKIGIKKLIFCYSNSNEKKILKSILPVSHCYEYRFVLNTFLACFDNLEIVDIIKLDVKKGFENELVKVISVNEILEIKNIPTFKPLRNNIIDISQINIDDYVVHAEQGVGKYLGLKAIQILNSPHDCLVIEYAEKAKLYVPVENIKLISRYGNSNTNIELDRLGSSSWSNKKLQVKKKIRDLASSLLEQAAKRKMSKGIKIHINYDKLNKFNSLFNYVETEDQLATIHEVYNDLTKGQLMDRLVCGDVGFGKTEVALRAAFLMSDNSYKTILIVPTTILAMQHYENFSKRFKNYTEVGLITRNTKLSDKKNILKKYETEYMNILISTHTAFAFDFKNIKLGLLIVDEEQHFGVAQKEKIKQIKDNIHLLTLTATPIPRTLHMSLLGIRELSLIQTPPIDRKTIKTIICKFDNIIIKNAIFNEIKRKGQIFIITPRIKDIDSLTKRIKLISPHTNFAIAHGRLKPTHIEKAMQDFYNHKVDILISTSIIESGIDIPRANTLIVNNADRFGLAQLHQLRGRIGRSHLRAYAFFTLGKNKITPNAHRRLKALQAMDALGAGINLANYDLDIRGAGNLLGEEQSGQVSQIGIELYQRLLQECLDDIKGVRSEKNNSSIDVSIKLPVLIPEKYIPDLSLRLSMYRKLGDLNNTEDISHFRLEMIDRFGKIPIEFENLINVIILKAKSFKAFIKKIQVNDQKYIIFFDEDYKEYSTEFIKWIEDEKDRILLRSTHVIEIKHSLENASEQLLNIIEIVNIMLKYLIKGK